MAASGKKRSWIDDLPLQAQQDLLAAAETKSYKKGEIVYRRGTKLFGVYTVQSGRLEALRAAFENDKFILRIVYPGESLGLTSLFSKEGGYNTMIALEDAELIYIPKAVLMEFVGKYPIIFEKVMEAVGEFISRAIGWIDFSLSATAAEKVRWNLVHLSQFSQADPDGSISISISQQEFARMIGLSRQVVNAELNRLVAKNIVEMRYGALRLNASALQSMRDELSA